MRVLVPLNNIEHMQDYMDAGAGEFYIGFYDNAWWKEFGEYADINRMSGYKERANPHDFQKVLQIIQEIKKFEKLIYVTFNSSMYSKEQFVYIRKYFQELKKVGVDGVIVSCVELVKIAEEIGLPSVISTISGVYNSDIARFYAKEGAKRIILPRDLSVEEIEKITKEVKEVEYEVFMMRNGCMYSDSNCLGFHRSEKCSVCSSIIQSPNEIKMEKDDFKTRNATELNDMIYLDHFHPNACGLCAIYRFVKMGITACKIVGRSDEWECVCEDIRMVARNVEIAKVCESEEEFFDKMEMPEDRVTRCKLGLSCYYPEMRF
ncbi:collagenase family protease [Lachnospiraceae bacterium KM106-2]|nr:collagenase family protease [Lachnospiraceae bacterium KM106-2]